MMQSTATTHQAQEHFPLCRSKHWRFPRLLIVAGILVLSPLLTDHGTPAAQQQPPAAQTDDKPNDDLQRLYSERRVAQQIQELSAAAKKNDSRTVRDLLTMLRAADPALMVADPRGTFMPLHRGLVLRILEFPPQLRNDLRTDDASAASALKRSLESESPDGLIRMLHRHAGTEASWRAHLILAVVHADRGHRHGAAFWLAPLLNTQVPPHLTSAAELLQSRMNPHSAGVIGLQKDGADAATNDKERLGGLTPTARLGNEASELMPKHLQWVNSLPLPARAKRISQALVKGASDIGFVPWSAWEPVIDDAQVFVRTPDSISAFAAGSGEQLWTRAIGRCRDSPTETVDPRIGPGIPMDDQTGNAAEVSLLHRNEMAGRMTSDPLRLFAVCTASDFQPTAQREDSMKLRFMLRRGQFAEPGLRELAAFEKQTGRRLWTTGGVPIEKRFGNELATAWFAGPPAVSGRDLFSVIEMDSVIQLVCLSAETGALRWTMTLGYPENPITQDPVRQLVAARLLATEGLVFATTTTGWICAVDQVTRTMLWARRLPLVSSDNAQLRAIRNSSFLAQQLLPFNAVWRSETPILAADTLILFSSQSHQMMALNPVDGKLRLKSDSDKARALLYADATMLVVASAESITAWQIEGMQKLWTTSCDQRESVPVGRAVRQGEQLLVPMSDGSIRPMNLRNGLLAEALTGLRPAYSSGGLFATGDDVLSYAPDHLARLSSDVPEPQPGQDALKQALFLAETGRLMEASVALSTAAEDRLNADEIRRLRFRLAAALFAEGIKDGDAALKEIRELASSDQEQAVSRFLLLDDALQRSADESTGLLLESLELDDEILAVEIPDREVLLDTLRSPANPLAAIDPAAAGLHVRRPLKAWVQQQLRKLLGDADAERTGTLLTSVDRLSDADLLSLHAPALRDEYLRRADTHLQAGMATETTVHLLLEAYDLSNNAASPTTDGPPAAETEAIVRQLDRMVRQFDERAADDPVAAEMSRTLLRVLRTDLTAEVATEATTAVPDARDLIADRWKELSGRSYTVVPVSTVSTMPFRQYNDRPVSPGSSRDRFLTAFDWSLRREPGVLTARSVSDITRPLWSLNTRAAENLMPQARDRLSRFGSVLVLQTGEAVSAFSAIDRRWLWSRRIQDTSSGLRLSAIRGRGFEDFNSITQKGSGRDRRICGAGLRWICLHTNDSVEMIDLLSGDALWRVPGVTSPQPVIACPSAVRVMNLKAHDTALLSRIDGGTLLTSRVGPVGLDEYLRNSDTAKLILDIGKLQRQEASLDLMTSAICSSGDAIVVWNPKTNDKGIKALDWIHPVTHGLLRRVELPNVRFSQFLDETTLAGVTDDETVLVVDLQSGRTQTLSFADPAKPDADKMNPERVAVIVDAASFYVFETATPAMMAPAMMPFIYGLNVETVQKEIRAVSRRAGTFAWKVPVPEGTFVCVDHSVEPVLLLVQATNPVGGAKAAVNARGLFPNSQKSSITGLSRTSGATVFTYPVVARNPLPGLRIHTNREQSMDLDAFGNRVRLVPKLQ